MRITIYALGTRGDVQPAVALGRALHARGHLVRLLAGANFAPWITQHGLEVAPSALDIQTIMESAGGLDWIEHGHNPMRQLQTMRQLGEQYGLQMATDAYHASRDAELIISQFTSSSFAPSIAQKVGARHISAVMQPTMFPTRSGAATMDGPMPDQDSWLNYLFGRLILQRVNWMMYGSSANRLRREVLGLPPQDGAQNQAELLRTPFLLGYSPRISPLPPDWPPTHHITGYWFLDDEDPTWQAPAALTRFLEAGPAPVCIGFGSMTGRDMRALSALVIEAVQKAGVRALLLSGWSGLGEMHLPETMLAIPSAPHSWLYPRMAAVMHHGGAGTTAASLRAGRPTLIIPHMVDQPFWGRRVAALGVGPHPIPRHQLTVARLVPALQQAVNNRAMRARAEALGAQIRAEQGVATAVALIERYGRG